ncbi:MAG: alpha-L-fucosidase [Clostridia bacterium]|nr:alpha-L-fucosidase [Clostridia bacterium]
MNQFITQEELKKLEDAKTWFRAAKYGMMMHWGLYALTAGEWKGVRDTEHHSEWIQYCQKIPCAEYHQLAKCFNPILFDADEYVRLAIDAGMRYMVVTAKHHDGFAMYHSKVSSFNVVDATPFHRDVIGELANACAKHGLKFGLYYSQDLDWSERNGGRKCGNTWDFPAEGYNYAECFENKIMPQVEEILTQYGDLCCIWFDMPLNIAPEQTGKLYRLVKHLQPACLVNSRIGNGYGDYTSTHDNEIPDDNKGELLYESPATVNDTWGFKYYDNNWKNPMRIREIREYLNERGINYLLNVGPDALGRIPVPTKEILLAAHPVKR